MQLCLCVWMVADVHVSFQPRHCQANWFKASCQIIGLLGISAWTSLHLPELSRHGCCHSSQRDSVIGCWVLLLALISSTDSVSSLRVSWWITARDFAGLIAELEILNRLTDYACGLYDLDISCCAVCLNVYDLDCLRISCLYCCERIQWMQTTFLCLSSLLRPVPASRTPSNGADSGYGPSRCCTDPVNWGSVRVLLLLLQSCSKAPRLRLHGGMEASTISAAGFLITRLDSQNYTTWSQKVRLLLKHQSLWMVVSEPPDVSALSAALREQFRKDNEKALCLIGLTLEDQQVIKHRQPGTQSYIKRCSETDSVCDWIQPK